MHFPSEKLVPNESVRLWDWGAFPEKDELMPDHKIAQWASGALRKSCDQPLFLAVGFYRPHVPLYAPQKRFDLYPEETLQLRKVIEDDLDDIPAYGVNLTRLRHIAPTHKWVVENDQWKPLVRSYLACISFVDHQVGKVLDALETSGRADNTIAVF